MFESSRKPGMVIQCHHTESSELERPPQTVLVEHVDTHLGLGSSDRASAGVLESAVKQ